MGHIMNGTSVVLCQDVCVGGGCTQDKVLEI